PFIASWSTGRSRVPDSHELAQRERCWEPRGGRRCDRRAAARRGAAVRLAEKLSTSALNGLPPLCRSGTKSSPSSQSSAPPVFPRDVDIRWRPKPALDLERDARDVAVPHKLWMLG